MNDDADCCRVGLKAAADFQVASPIDALTKAEVRGAHSGGCTTQKLVRRFCRIGCQNAKSVMYVHVFVVRDNGGSGNALAVSAGLSLVFFFLFYLLGAG